MNTTTILLQVALTLFITVTSFAIVAGTVWLLCHRVKSSGRSPFDRRFVPPPAPVEGFKTTSQRSVKIGTIDTPMPERLLNLVRQHMHDPVWKSIVEELPTDWQVALLRWHGPAPAITPANTEAKLVKQRDDFIGAINLRVIRREGESDEAFAARARKAMDEMVVDMLHVLPAFMPYETYWSKRALAAEKELEQLRKSRFADQRHGSAW